MPDAHAMVESLRRLGLLSSGELPEITPLAGGVSSDIAKVSSGGRVFCVKRALPKLKVQADWRAPVERNHWEAQWMRTVAAIDPSAAPAVLGEDRELGLLAMAYLDEASYPIWKQQLAQGLIDTTFAQKVGERMARIHSATARHAEIRERFATDHIFFPIRLEPYLLATAAAHPDCAPQLVALAQATAHTKLALMHGDVSPKNILCGPQGPVFLDAECACYGDPAFDLAFCLNHMMLKCLWQPQWTARYLKCFGALAGAYLRGVDWEARESIETRTARLLPGLFLARVDGKSPVEYITQDWQRARVRAVARTLLLEPVGELSSVRYRWGEAMSQGNSEP
ncbi:MAG: aminoglycoside phosphotransferase family protein [Betaproteobacteria bacterium]|nr:aminoglycoside phosphotransferase family protein [Betaproteobacteria bacterium]